MFRNNKGLVAALVVGMVSLPLTSAMADNGQRRHRSEDRRDRRAASREWRGYDDGRYQSVPYDAARYYRDDYRYSARQLGPNDYIYRGYDNQYYCSHGDGTTRLIVGGVAGGVLGHVLAPGHSKTLGAIIGAGGGALLGRTIDRNHVTCR